MSDSNIIKKKMSMPMLTLMIAALVVLDQVTKYVIKTTMHLGQSFKVLGSFFRITYVENPGMAFGIRVDNIVLFLTLSVVAAVLVFYYLYRLRNEGWLLQTALGFIASGAIGNLIDRFLYGRVVDFLDFEFWDVAIPAFSFIGLDFPGYSMTRWPVFNVADMAVSGGMMIIIFYLIVIGDPLKETYNSSIESSHG